MRCHEKPKHEVSERTQTCPVRPLRGQPEDDEGHTGEEDTRQREDERGEDELPLHLQTERQSHVRILATVIVLDPPTLRFVGDLPLGGLALQV